MFYILSRVWAVSKIFSLYLQHFQREIVRGVEGIISTGVKQLEVGKFYGVLISSQSSHAIVSLVQVFSIFKKRDLACFFNEIILWIFWLSPHLTTKLEFEWASFAANKLAEDCRKYATEGPSNGGALARASAYFGTARTQMERERDNMHRSIGTQVYSLFPLLQK